MHLLKPKWRYQSDALMEGHDEDHANELPKSKYV